MDVDADRVCRTLMNENEDAEGWIKCIVVVGLISTQWDACISIARCAYGSKCVCIHVCMRCAPLTCTESFGTEWRLEDTTVRNRHPCLLRDSFGCGLGEEVDYLTSLVLVILLSFKLLTPVNKSDL